MSQQYCIYFGAKPYYITDILSEEMLLLTQCGGTIVMNQPGSNCIAQTVHQLQHSDAAAVIILSSQVTYYWQQFQNLFTPVTAAGGLVLNENNHYLFIFRRGKWDLPKGKLDEGENIVDCALREVQEETGLQKVMVDTPLGSTWHVYPENGQWMLKESIWFIMKGSSDERLVPQLEEEITKIEWVPPGALAPKLDNTFPSVLEVIRRKERIFAT